LSTTRDYVLVLIVEDDDDRVVDYESRGAQSHVHDTAGERF